MIEPARNTTRRCPVHLAIDPGRPHRRGLVPGPAPARRPGHKVNVFADYFAEGLSAEANAAGDREQ